MKRLLPKLAAVLTRHPRQLVTTADFTWTSSLVYNAFRVYELLFGRRWGIKAEMSGWIQNGVAHYECYTWEATFALIEANLRAFRLPKLQLVKVPVLKFAPAYAGGKQLPPQYRYAIAANTGAAAAASSNTGQTLSYTITGSNTLLLAHCGTASGTGTTGVTWNGSALTHINSTITDSASENFDMYAFVGGSGTQSIISSVGSGFNSFVATSYSGVTQSTTPDSSNRATDAVNGTTSTISTTVVAANCWTFMTVGSTNLAPTAGTGSFLRKVDGNIFLTAFDSNATVGTGSVSMSVGGGGGGTQFSEVIASFAPVAAAVVAPSITSDIVFFN